MEERIPLYLHDVSLDERALLIRILSIAKDRKLLNQTKLAEDSQLDFHHMIPKGKAADDDHPPPAMEPDRATIAHTKWVYLYNYVMNTLHDVCVAHKDQDLLDRINALHDLGMASGRYATDMHIFNREALAIDLRQQTVNDNYLNGPYALLRHRSDGKAIVVSALHISKLEDRFVFAIRTVTGGHDRLTRGLAYDLGDHLHLFGFMNGETNAEFFTLQSPDNPKHFLSGVMQTANTDRIYHAKQCFAVRIDQLYGTESIGENVVHDRQARQRLKDASEDFLRDKDKGLLHLRERILDISQALSTTMVSVQHAQLIEPPEGPAG